MTLMHACSILAQMALVFFAALGFCGILMYLLRLYCQRHSHIAKRMCYVYIAGADRDPGMYALLYEQLELTELLNTRPSRLKLRPAAPDGDKDYRV